MDTKELINHIKTRIAEIEQNAKTPNDLMFDVMNFLKTLDESKLRQVGNTDKPQQTEQKFDFGAECNCMPRITCEHCEVKEPQTNEGELIELFRTIIDSLVDKTTGKMWADLEKEFRKPEKRLFEKAFKALQNTNEE